MPQADLTCITSFIWGIADDVLRALHVRGKCRDVILPVTVLRRLDVVLEPTKAAVLEMKAMLDGAGVVNQDGALRQAAGQAFYNTSLFTLRVQSALAVRDDTAAPVTRKIHKAGKAVADPLRGRYEATVAGKPVVVEYEPDAELRDSKQVPLLEEGGIEAFLRREVLPHAPDAWYAPESVKTGYEISFTRYFYKPAPLRTREEIRADILAVERETEGLLAENVGSAR